VYAEVIGDLSFVAASIAAIVSPKTERGNCGVATAFADASHGVA
jgi:hypothetical protein